MSTVAKVALYEFHDVIRGRWLVAYGLVFLAVTDSLFRFGGGSERVLLSLVNLVLVIVPLMSLVFGTIFHYNAREFIQLLLAQPVGRPQLFTGLFLGLAAPLAGAFALGVGLPFLLHGLDGPAQRVTLLVLLLTGVLLTLAFTALAFLISVTIDDRMKGLGVAILGWLALAVLYDGLVLLAVDRFADYPLERPMIAAMLLNPVDTARVLLLLRLDVSALMGYTGAVFERFFGAGPGTAVSIGALALWFAVPFALALRRFRRKDL